MRTLPKFQGFPAPDASRGTRYESLARAIVFQQLAYKAADTIHGRVCALTPGSRFPKPAELLTLPEGSLRGAGLSAAKFAAVRDLAGHIQDGRLHLSSIHHHDDDRIIELLTAVRGIGVWTAQMFLIFHLGRLDVLPSGDLGVQEGLRILDDLEKRPTPKELEARGAVWAPLSSVACWMLYRVVDEAADKKAKAKSKAKGGK
ncbi:MAG: DNA-3-methyladenine glycosylase 2 family protein [Planctomycetes bacterium]|nr:DNA-3-methyladenine glycosylase 2 family protein [Planctomycetota bacterium]MCP4771186.1 DNA-3-methyladenine glycosylase 2 family protein [Planctomycetota bacterium]MCP4862087.1 DNA-3-methyladenine glycosylase 2 family protein [Planctomycetota bacterium]